MRGLDDSEPEENDDVRVRKREAIPVSTRVRGRTVGKRACDEVERKREKRGREKERGTDGGGEEDEQERGC